MWPQCETLASPDHVTGDSRATARIATADQAFCVAYVGGARFNATDAARRAYPNIKDADVYGTTVLRRPKVAAYVANLKVRANKIAEEKFDLTIERIAHEFCAIAFFEIIDLFNDDGTLKPLKEMTAQARQVIADIGIATGRHPDCGRTKVIHIKLCDKLKALEALGRWKKMFIDRIETGSPGEFEQMSDADLIREVKRTEQRLAKLRQQTRAPQRPRTL